MSLLKNDSAKSLDSRVLAVFKKAKGLAIEANEKDNVLLYNRQEDLNDLLLMLRDLKISGVDVDSLREREIFAIILSFLDARLFVYLSDGTGLETREMQQRRLQNSFYWRRSLRSPRPRFVSFAKHDYVRFVLKYAQRNNWAYLLESYNESNKFYFDDLSFHERTMINSTIPHSLLESLLIKHITEHIPLMLIVPIENIDYHTETSHVNLSRKFKNKFDF